ncbi:hypothetical protein, partial [Campylobacter troglodytis]|uniref:hypothetical protein n=1 Tax=Campylobacter troglodytis TaxID=654363 RepID=UPI001C8E83BE
SFYLVILSVATQWVTRRETPKQKYLKMMRKEILRLLRKLRMTIMRILRFLRKLKITNKSNLLEFKFKPTSSL